MLNRTWGLSAVEQTPLAPGSQEPETVEGMVNPILAEAEEYNRQRWGRGSNLRRALFRRVDASYM